MNHLTATLCQSHHRSLTIKLSSSFLIKTLKQKAPLRLIKASISEFKTKTKCDKLRSTSGYVRKIVEQKWLRIDSHS